MCSTCILFPAFCGIITSMYNDPMPQNIEQLIISAGNGDSEAQYKLGTNYHFGRMGVNQDYALAAEWYRKAAEQGHLKAAYYLGTLYQNAQGVPQNYEEAAQWYKIALNPNDNKAQLALGFLYKNGLGVEKNDSIADEFFEQAARFDKIKELMSSGIKLTQGREETRDYVRAMECFKEAFRMGEVKAPYYIGMMYKDGLGIERNYRKAGEWLNKAVELGDLRAARVLKWLSETQDINPEPMPGKPEKPEAPEEPEPHPVQETPKKPKAPKKQRTLKKPKAPPIPETKEPQEVPEILDVSAVIEAPQAVKAAEKLELLKPVPLSKIQHKTFTKKPERKNHDTKKKISKFKLIMFFVITVLVMITGFYLYQRIKTFFRGSNPLTAILQNNDDKTYYESGVINLNDLPSYTLTTGQLRHDKRYTDGIADVTGHDVKLYAMPDERSPSIPNATGLQWLFEDSLNRIRRFRKVADDFSARYENMLHIRGTWQQAKESGQAEGIWRRYYREEQNLQAKKQSALKALALEINHAKDKIKSPQTLTYLGEWISPDGKKWTLAKLNPDDKIVWLDSNYVRLMTFDEYQKSFIDSLKMIGS